MNEQNLGDESFSHALATWRVVIQLHLEMVEAAAKALSSILSIRREPRLGNELYMLIKTLRLKWAE